VKTSLHVIWFLVACSDSIADLLIAIYYFRVKKRFGTYTAVFMSGTLNRGIGGGIFSDSPLAGRGRGGARFCAVSHCGENDQGRGCVDICRLSLLLAER
jgi:hypothetical protein